MTGKRFTINLNKETHARLASLNGSYGDKANFMRLALQVHLIRMTPKTYALSLAGQGGPFPHKMSFNVNTKSKKWYETLLAKAESLETSPATLARVCLGLFLEDLEREGQNDR